MPNYVEFLYNIDNHNHWSDLYLAREITNFRVPKPFSWNILLLPSPFPLAVGEREGEGEPPNQIIKPIY